MRLAKAERGPSTADIDRLGEIVALAYPDRIAQARGDAVGQFRLTSGRGAVLPPTDGLAAEAFLAVAALDGDARSARIFLAAPLDRAAIEEQFADRFDEAEEITWDAQNESVVATRERRLGALVLERKPIAAPDPQALARAMAEGIRQLGLSTLPWSPDARAIQARIAFLRRLDADRWPDVSDAALATDPLAWLGEKLGGITRRAHLARIDVAAALLDRLDWKQRRDLDRLAPTHIDVPDGAECDHRLQRGVARAGRETAGDVRRANHADGGRWTRADPDPPAVAGRPRRCR